MAADDHDLDYLQEDVDDHDLDYLQEDGLLLGVRLSGGNGAEALTRIELDLAYSSEKLLNLEILLMLVADRADDFEALDMEYENISDESVLKVFESDTLAGILDMEVNELQSFMSLVQNEIVEARQNLYHCDDLEISADKVEEKLHDAENSLKKLQDSIADMRNQTSKFERTLALCHGEARTDVIDELENGHSPSISTKWKPQAVDQQRHVLQMLEKSLARELELEKNLSDSRLNEEDHKRRLLYTEKELCMMEEVMDICLERTFEAENASEVLLGISKEFAGKIQVAQLNLNSSLLREHEMQSKLLREHEMQAKLQESLTKLHAEKSAKAKVGNLHASEILSLKEKVRALEEQLSESGIQLQLTNACVESSNQQRSALQSELTQMEDVIENLKTDVLMMKNRAECAEAKYAELRITNIELNEELVFVQNRETESTNGLERRCKELDVQLDNARASVEALEEQQIELYSAITDMQNMIDDLKAKVSKAESKAESTESKCKLLTETNSELNEELGFLRGKLEYLETSLHKVESAKIVTAKDIGIRTKIISDLVLKLAVEREHLELQISALIKKNKTLSEKCKANDRSSVSYKGILDEVEPDTKSSEVAYRESLTKDYQMESLAAAVHNSGSNLETTALVDEAPSSDSKNATVRTIEASQLDPKYIFTAILILFIAVLTFYAYQQESIHA